MRMKRPNQVNSMIIWILITFGVCQSCLTSRRNTPSPPSWSPITTSFSRLPHEPSSFSPYKSLRISSLRISEFVCENENDMFYSNNNEERLHCYNGGKRKYTFFIGISKSLRL